MGKRKRKILNEQQHKKILIETYIILWIVCIGGILIGIIETMSRITGYWNTPAFIFVFSTYAFIGLFLFIIYGEKLKWLKIKLK